MKTSRSKIILIVLLCFITTLSVVFSAETEEMSIISGDLKIEQVEPSLTVQQEGDAYLLFSVRNIGSTKYGSSHDSIISITDAGGLNEVQFSTFLDIIDPNERQYFYLAFGTSGVDEGIHTIGLKIGTNEFSIPIQVISPIDPSIIPDEMWTPINFATDQLKIEKVGGSLTVQQEGGAELLFWVRNIGSTKYEGSDNRRIYITDAGGLNNVGVSNYIHALDPNERQYFSLTFQTFGVDKGTYTIGLKIGTNEFSIPIQVIGVPAQTTSAPPTTTPAPTTSALPTTTPAPTTTTPSPTKSQSEIELEKQRLENEKQRLELENVNLEQEKESKRICGPTSILLIALISGLGVHAIEKRRIRI